MDWKKHKKFHKKNNRIHQNPKNYYKIIKLKKLYRELYLQLEKKPSLDELSNYANIDKEKIEELFSYYYKYTSLYSKVNNESEKILLDFIIDYNKSVEEIVIDKEFKDFINYILFDSNLLDEE